MADIVFFFSSRRRHTRLQGDWSSDVCSSDLYEREVGLDDFVSVREAAQLLDLPIMTVGRWVKGKVLKGSKKRGFAVIPVREVLRMAKERKRKLRLGSRLVVIG